MMARDLFRRIRAALRDERGVINIPALAQIGAQPTGNLNGSFIDGLLATIRGSLTGLVMTQAEINAAIAAAIAANPGALPLAYLSGYGTNNNAGDAVNDIDIAIGACRDITNAQNIVLASALTKRLDAAWAVGTNQGGLDIGTIADGSYHLYAIKRSDTGVVDALESRNPDVAATITVTIASPAVVTWTNHGLQAGSTVVFTTTGALPTGLSSGTRVFVIATGLTVNSFQVAATEGGAAINTSGSQSGVHTGTSSPVLPTNYDFRRRIYSFKRSGATILAYVQDGNWNQYAVSILDVSDATNPGTAAVTRTLSVPIGINTIARMVVMNIDTASTNNGVVMSDLATTDETSNERAVAATSAVGALGQAMIDIRTSVGAQIRSRLRSSTATLTFSIRLIGWWDHRGFK